tara:strand:- start:5803 stop:6351 length:549 start_codon:yes stop_codon:yes gene_type:complete
MLSLCQQPRRFSFCRQKSFRQKEEETIKLQAALQKRHEDTLSTTIAYIYKIKANIESCNDYNLFNIKIPESIINFENSIEKDDMIYSFKSHKYYEKLFMAIENDFKDIGCLLKLLSYGHSNTLYAVPQRTIVKFMALYPELYRHFLYINFSSGLTYDKTNYTEINAFIPSKITFKTPLTDYS